MAESPDHAATPGESVPNGDAALPVANLPVVIVATNGEDKKPDPAADVGNPPAARMRSRRFLMLAASVAFAAGFGSFVGSVSGSGLVRLIYPAPQQSPAPVPAMGIEKTLAAMHEIKLELAGIAAIKASLENATRTATGQYAKIADRLDRIDQRSVVVAETTASLPAGVLSAAPLSAGPVSPAPLSPAPPAASANTPPSAEPAKLTDRVLQDWIVHDVRNGRALVESRYGGLFAVGAGSVLPGIGRVDIIKRQDGHWVVLTARGTITSAR